MKKQRKKLTLAAMLLLLVFTMVMPLTSHAAAKISAKSKTLYVESSYQLKIRGTKKKVKWSSSNKKIATVSAKGKVKAKKAGKAKITAKIGKQKLVCNITVKARGLNFAKKNLYVGSTVQLKLSGIKGKAKWSSSNKKVATVNSKGKVKAKKEGTATIVAKVGTKKYKCKVTAVSKKTANKRACAMYRNKLKAGETPWDSWNETLSPDSLSFICKDVNGDGIKDLLVMWGEAGHVHGFTRVYTYCWGKFKSYGAFGLTTDFSINKNFVYDYDDWHSNERRTFFKLCGDGTRRILAEYWTSDIIDPRKNPYEWENLTSEVIVKYHEGDHHYPYYYHSFLVNGKKSTYKNCMATIRKLTKGAKYTKLSWHKNTSANRAKYIK